MTSRMYSGVTMLCFTSTPCSPELVDPGPGFNCVSHDGRGAGALAPVAGLQAGPELQPREYRASPTSIEAGGIGAWTSTSPRFSLSPHGGGEPPGGTTVVINDR